MSAILGRRHARVARSRGVLAVLVVAPLGGGAAGVAVAVAGPPLSIAALAAPLVLAAAIDLRTRRIPNWLTAGGLAGALALAAVDATLPAAVAGAVGAGALGVLVHVAVRGGFGMGDVKLMTYSGAALGLGAIPAFLFLMSLAGGLIAAVYLLTGAGRRTTIPYGPAIAAGALITLLTA